MQIYKQCRCVINIQYSCDYNIMQKTKMAKLQARIKCKLNTYAESSLVMVIRDPHEAWIQ